MHYAPNLPKPSMISRWTQQFNHGWKICKKSIVRAWEKPRRVKQLNKEKEYWRKEIEEEEKGLINGDSEDGGSESEGEDEDGSFDGYINEVGERVDGGGRRMEVKSRGRVESSGDDEDDDDEKERLKERRLGFFELSCYRTRSSCSGGESIKRKKSVRKGDISWPVLDGR
ncbi:MAG: hypothetical protein Q9218_002336 [Villophora microphyllina]